MDTGITFILNRSKLGCAVFLLASLLGCGSSDNLGCEQEVNIESPDGTSFLVKAEMVEHGSCVPPELKQVYSANSGNVIFGFYLYTEDVDLSNVLANRNDEASFVYFPNESDKSGMESPLTLYVSCAEDTADILVCPGVASLEEVTEGCPDSVTLTYLEEVDNYEWLSHISGDDECIISVQVEDLGNGFGAKAL